MKLKEAGISSPDLNRTMGFFSRESNREKAAGILFITPLLIYFIIFQAAPIVMGFIYSLTKWNMRTTPVYVGMDNFMNLLFNAEKYPNFWPSLLITLKFMLIVIPLSLIFPLLLAVFLDRVTRFQGLFKVLYYIPVVTSGVAVAAMWRWILDSYNGLLNNIITAIPILGDKIGKVAWLDNPSTALPIIAVMIAWQSVGYNILVYMAGLKSISPELYEYAQIDGAGFRDRVFKITLPLLKPTFFFLIVTNMISGFQLFDQMYVLTSGGPQNSTYTYVIGLYLHAVRYNEFGVACAMGYILFAITLVITLINFKFIPQNYE